MFSVCCAEGCLEGCQKCPDKQSDIAVLYVLVLFFFVCFLFLFLFIFLAVVQKNVLGGAKSVQRRSLALAQIGEHTD